MHCKLWDAELLTAALLAARFFHGNLHSACAYVWEHHWVHMIDKSGFTRRFHGLRGQLVALFLALGQRIKELKTGSVYLVDSFPVAVCDNICIACCRLQRGKAYRGKSATKRRHFYSFRV